MLKDKLAELAEQMSADGVKFVTTLDGKQIYMPVYLKRMNVGMPIYFAVKDGKIKVLDGEEGLEMFDRILEKAH